MKYESTAQEVRRAYRQTARAEATEATGERILDAFSELLRDSWFDEIRLEDVAKAAGVSVQTVIRRFGGKEGLLEAAQAQLDHVIRSTRAIPAGDIASAVKVLLADYEHTGDLLIRILAQEARQASLKTLTDAGRAGHRGWLRDVVAPWLDALSSAEAERRLDAVVAVTDVYVWKLLRRDLGRPVAQLEALMLQLIPAALAGDGQPQIGELR